MVLITRRACINLMRVLALLAFICLEPVQAKGHSYISAHSHTSSSSHHSPGPKASHHTSSAHLSGSHTRSTASLARSYSSSRATTTPSPRVAPGVARNSHGRIARGRQARADFQRSEEGWGSPGNMQRQTTAQAKAEDRVE